VSIWQFWPVRTVEEGVAHVGNPLSADVGPKNQTALLPIPPRSHPRQPGRIPHATQLRQLRLDLVNTINGGRIIHKNVAFLPGTLHYDLCCVHLGNYQFLVSDRLTERLIELRLTGFELVPASATFE
jgi:hypothetical protein